MGATTAGPGRFERDVTRRIVQVLLTQALFVALFAAGAGTFAWPPLWALVGVQLLLLVVNLVYVFPRNPTVIVERGKLHKGTARFDRVLSPLYAVGMLGLFAVAGLDAVRLQATELSSGWRTFGLVLIVLGDLPVVWAMAVNPFLEPTVRVQEERGHRAVTRGVYAWIRHPMYLGALLSLPGVCLALGSQWALVVAVALMGLVVVRTALEDRFLTERLDGYREYTKKVRYRLIPFVW